MVEDEEDYEPRAELSGKVCSEECPTCVFRPGNLMDLAPGRLREMVERCRRDDTNIICHERIHIDQAACRGHVDRYGYGQLLRIMGRLRGSLEEVDPAQKRSRDQEEAQA